MEYLNRLISAWMPRSSPRVAVDSHPRLSGIMDTINASRAHGPDTRLPAEFYDPKALKIIEKIALDEWFSGYNENREYRALGIGALVGDIVERMTAKIEQPGLTEHQVGGEDGRTRQGRGSDTNIKFAMSGCHDTTLAGLLASLGALGEESWPPFTSHIALELFRKKEPSPIDKYESTTQKIEKHALATPAPPGIFASMLGLFSPTKEPLDSTNHSQYMGRRPTADLSTAEKAKLNGYYVRIRYNDKVMTVPGCKKAGNHLDGDETFCTMAAFKAIADEYTPRDWKQECDANMEAMTIKPAGQEEWAGFHRTE